MEVPDERALLVLRYSILTGPEDGCEGSMFPNFHKYCEAEGAIRDARVDVGNLRDELARMYPMLNEMNIGILEHWEFVPVEIIGGQNARAKLRDMVEGISELCEKVLSATGDHARVPESMRGL